jgi:hypothetical protein
MITVGGKILILGGEGPTGQELYEDAVVELDSSKLVFPEERRNTLQTPQFQNSYPPRTSHSLYDPNPGNREGISEPPQVTRAHSDYRHVQRSGTLREMSPRVATHSEHVPMPPTPTYYNPIQRQGTLSRATATYGHGTKPYFINTTIPTSRSDMAPSPVLRSTIPIDEQSTVPVPHVDISGHDEDLDSLQQRYIFDGQWSSDYIPRSELDDFLLLNFIRQHSSSETAQRLKLVVLDQCPHDYLTHFACGEGKAASDGIEYQRYIDGGSNGEVHQVRSVKVFQLMSTDVLQENESSKRLKRKLNI